MLGASNAASNALRCRLCEQRLKATSSPLLVRTINPAVQVLSNSCPGVTKRLADHFRRLTSFQVKCGERMA